MKLRLPLVFGFAVILAASASAQAVMPPVVAPAATPPAAASTAAPMAGPPVVQARTWVLVDFATGQALAENNADQRIEPASLTKLMSAYVVFCALRDGRLKMNESVPISEQPGAPKAHAPLFRWAPACRWKC